jgi:flagellin
MSLVVGHNSSALNIQRQLLPVTNRLNQSFERLSSGFRINSAADDAAGLQIADRLQSDVISSRQVVRNLNDGISYAQIAEEALDEVNTAAQRMRQLAVQAQNGIHSDSDRLALDKEFQQLKSEIA